MRSALSILIVCLFSACSSMNYVGIETYNPAEITFPENVGKVLIVNNAIPQPDKSGFEYKLFGAIQDTARLNADSALVAVCQGLGKAILDVSYFDDVLLFNVPTRKDERFYSDEKLTPEQILALCRETGADAVISVDRMLFETDVNVVAFPEGYVAGDIAVKMAGVMRAYIPGRSNPLATVLLSDSLFWSEAADNIALLSFVLPSPENAVRAAGQYIGAKASPNFVPHWKNETRWYYSGVGSQWKEASAYAATEKWEMAAARWKQLFERSSGKNKAKAAANLALYHEMKSELAEALDWATQSLEMFKKSAGDDDRNTKLLNLYVEALTSRIHSDKKLNMQFGKE